MNSLKAFVACALVMAFGVMSTLGQASHYDVSNIDTKTAACADFYQYANGGWLAANPIPAAYPAWGIANVLNEKNRDVLHDILEAAAKNTAAKKAAMNRRSAITTPAAWKRRRLKLKVLSRCRQNSI